MRTVSGQRSRTSFRKFTPVMPGMRWSHRITLTGCALQQAARLLGAAGGEDREILVQRAAHRVLRTHLVVDHQHGGQGFGKAWRCHSRCTARCRGVHACGLRVHEVVPRHVVAGIEAVEVAVHARQFLVAVMGQRTWRLVAARAGPVWPPTLGCDCRRAASASARSRHRASKPSRGAVDRSASIRPMRTRFGGQQRQALRHQSLRAAPRPGGAAAGRSSTRSRTGCPCSCSAG